MAYFVVLKTSITIFEYLKQVLIFTTIENHFRYKAEIKSNILDEMFDEKLI